MEKVTGKAGARVRDTELTASTSNKFEEGQVSDQKRREYEITEN